MAPDMQDPFKVFILKMADDEFYVMCRFADGSEEICPEAYDTYVEAMTAIYQDFQEVKLQ